MTVFDFDFGQKLHLVSFAKFIPSNCVLKPLFATALERREKAF